MIRILLNTSTGLRIVILGLILQSNAIAQDPTDALRWSWTLPAGTARQQAIGGAMGSLGGDLSATFVNPAGLAFLEPAI